MTKSIYNSLSNNNLIIKNQFILLGNNKDKFAIYSLDGTFQEKQTNLIIDFNNSHNFLIGEIWGMENITIPQVLKIKLHGETPGNYNWALNGLKIISNQKSNHKYKIGEINISDNQINKNLFIIDEKAVKTLLLIGIIEE
jgi:hypothetical protein